MALGEIIIESYSEKYGWCLELLVDENNAERNKQRLEKEFPNKKFRITRLSPKEASAAWWNGNLD